jgi:hypothetical protein
VSKGAAAQREPEPTLSLRLSVNGVGAGPSTRGGVAGAVHLDDPLGGEDRGDRDEGIQARVLTHDAHR